MLAAGAVLTLWALQVLYVFWRDRASPDAKRDLLEASLQKEAERLRANVEELRRLRADLERSSSDARIAELRSAIKLIEQGVSEIDASAKRKPATP